MALFSPAATILPRTQGMPSCISWGISCDQKRKRERGEIQCLWRGKLFFWSLHKFFWTMKGFSWTLSRSKDTDWRKNNVLHLSSINWARHSLGRPHTSPHLVLTTILVFFLFLDMRTKCEWWCLSWHLFPTLALLIGPWFYVETMHSPSWWIRLSLEARCGYVSLFWTMRTKSSLVVVEGDSKKVFAPLTSDFLP